MLDSQFYFFAIQNTGVRIQVSETEVFAYL
jgi:hypothetical protein